MPTIQIDVSVEVADFIAAKVADGSFESADSYISEAIHLMEESTPVDDSQKLAELKRIISKSLKQADRDDYAPYSNEQLEADLINGYE